MLSRLHAGSVGQARQQRFAGKQEGALGVVVAAMPPVVQHQASCSALGSRCGTASVSSRSRRRNISQVKRWQQQPVVCSATLAAHSGEQEIGLRLHLLFPICRRQASLRVVGHILFKYLNHEPAFKHARTHAHVRLYRTCTLMHSRLLCTRVRT